jgi:hypothetical protein
LAEVTGDHILHGEAVAGEFAEVVSDCVLCHLRLKTKKVRTTAPNVKEERARDISTNIEDMLVRGFEFVDLDPVNGEYMGGIGTFVYLRNPKCWMHG